MTSPPPSLAEIHDPLEDSGWRISRPDDEGALHGQMLRELCDQRHELRLGAAGAQGVAATLVLVDLMQQQLVLESRADGILLAGALQARPLWAAALLHGLRVQFPLMAPRAAREAPGSGAASQGERYLIHAHWPREIYRSTRRRSPRTAREPLYAPVVRFHHSNQLVSTREFAVMNISEGGGAVLLPAGMLPPALGSRIRRIELELDAERIVFTDAIVAHVRAQRRGTHHVGCRWEGMPAAGQRLLRCWLASVGENAALPPERAGASAVFD